MSKEYLDPQGFETAMQALKEKLDDRYAKESDIPTKTSDLDNDSGFITEVTSSDVVDALGYTPADTNDVPTKTSDLTNDSNFVSDASYVHTDNNYSNADKAAVDEINGIKDDVTQLSADKAEKIDVDRLDYMANNVLYYKNNEVTNDYIKPISADVYSSAKIEMIGGKSVVNNQLGKITEGTSQYSSGHVVVTRNSTYVTIQSDGQNGNTDGLFIFNISPWILFDGIGGHKIYFDTGITLPSGIALKAFYSIDGTWNTGNPIVTSATQGFYTTMPAEANYLGIYMQANANVTCDITLRPILVDLTKMFGAGNEPSSTAICRQIFTDYIPYDEGTILSADVNKIISKNSNNEIIGEYPIPSEVQALDGYGWSAGNVYNYVDFVEKKFHKRVNRKYLNIIFDNTATSGGTYSSGGLKFKDINDIPFTYNLNSTFSSLILNRDSGWVSTIKCISPQNDNVVRFYAEENSTFEGYLYYELPTEEIIDISAYITDNNITIEPEGTLTFNQTNASLKLEIPNKVTTFIKAENNIAPYWNATTTYSVGDYVMFKATLWKCLVQNSGQTPVEGTYWHKINVTSELKQHTYSTIEQIIGTWIDGKTLYEKVVDCGYITATTNTIDVTSLNIDKIIKIDFSIYTKNNQTWCFPIPFVAGFITGRDFNSGIGYQYLMTNNNITALQIISGNTRSNHGCYAVIQYTKNTN